MYLTETGIEKLVKKMIGFSIFISENYFVESDHDSNSVLATDEDDNIANNSGYICGKKCF